MLQHDTTGLEGLKAKGGLDLTGRQEVHVGEGHLSSPGERGGAHELEGKHGWVTAWERLQGWSSGCTPCPSRELAFLRDNGSGTRRAGVWLVSLLAYESEAALHVCGGSQ